MTELHETRPDTLEARLSFAVSTHHAFERDLKKLCATMLELQAEWVAQSGAEWGFLARCEMLGMPKATASRYVHAGVALKAGLDPNGDKGVTELSDLGNALLRGASQAELQAAKDPDGAARLSEARRNEGLVRFAVPLLYSGDVQAAANWAASRLEVSPPEGLGAVLTAFMTLSVTERETILGRVEVSHG